MQYIFLKQKLHVHRNHLYVFLQKKPCFLKIVNTIDKLERTCARHVDKQSDKHPLSLLDER
jgi:hypothetical protein